MNNIGREKIKKLKISNQINKSSMSLFSTSLNQNKKSNKNCSCCKGKGAVNCIPCNGKGIDKVNGDIFQRWTCNACKGFGYIPCSLCSPNSKGLTPEQTGER